MKKIWILTVGLVTVFATPPLAGASPPKRVGMANPASVHCNAIGGGFVTRKDKAGNEYGFCRLPDGRLCEEWALFRDNKCVGPKAAMRRK